MDTEPQVEQIYQKKSPLEHVLLRPDTYIGCIEAQTEKMWVIDDAKMVHRKVTYVPGLLKIFDELLVNAADNKQRDSSMTTLKVVINREQGWISVYNNGKGIPIEIHKEHNVYIPDLIFGELHTSSNYNDSEKRTTGGRNGYGAKLTNIFSKKFIVDTVDSRIGKRFRQTFSNNMSSKSEPDITDCSKSDYTKITFYPDFDRFGMKSGLDDDICKLFSKRVIDIAGIFGSKLKVLLNEDRVQIKNFQTYMDLYLTGPRFFIKVNDRWEVGVCVSDGHFQQVSFVNSICTVKGGKHVNTIADQVCKSIKDATKTGLKSGQIRNHLWIFVNALIVNPAFDSQAKETLTSAVSKFESDCTLPPEFLKLINKSDIITSIKTFEKCKETKDLKKLDGKKRARISGIPKLDDANDAGTKFGKDCTLILTEGDSAKALVVAGFSVVGRDRFGVFPLKGKLLNVRDASTKQISENKEITCLKQIIGLQHEKVYEDAKSLRYGHVMIMTDQDNDGSHIKGLVLNFFQKFWPSLFKLPGFLQEFITPVVKASHKSKPTLEFYTEPEFHAWKKRGESGYIFKYYKGLGTNTSEEGVKYFSNLGKHVIDFRYDQRVKTDVELALSIPDFDQWPDDKLMDMVFSNTWMKKETKKRWKTKETSVRKEWIARLANDTFVDQKEAAITGLGYNDFINKELILFSKASNERAIPCIMDGLKPGQRKIIFTCFQRNTKEEVKVAQLSGAVSERSAYHHGEESLNSTIVHLAQNYVGSNNVNLLVPAGQFGTRLTGGKDSASPRYIFTQLSPITRYVFPIEDDALFPPLSDDGKLVEPQWYAPILPMVLVNGSAGIGTGWSSSIPNFNPREIVNILKSMINNQSCDFNLIPWYRGFHGSIEREDSCKFKVCGTVVALENNEYCITELPIGYWTYDYKAFLESMITQNKISEFTEHHGTNTIQFNVTLSSDEIKTSVEAQGPLVFFKLVSSLSTSNMVLHDCKGNVKCYESVENIMKEFFIERLAKYVERKNYLLNLLQVDMIRFANMARFIREVNANEIQLRNESKNQILAQLESRKYDKLHSKEKLDKLDKFKESKESYDYLLSMPLWSLTCEKQKKLCSKLACKEMEITVLKAQTPEQLWENDLNKFMNEYGVYETEVYKAKVKPNKSEVKRKSDSKVKRESKKSCV